MHNHDNVMDKLDFSNYPKICIRRQNRILKQQKRIHNSTKSPIQAHRMYHHRVASKMELSTNLQPR